jgi:Protein of unknown function (DUF3237)
MAQINPPSMLLPDLRELRTTFLERRLAYALSFSYGPMISTLFTSSAQRLALRVSAPLAGPDQGQVFHALGDDRVPGLDARGHDLPVGFRVRGVTETVGLRWQQSEGGSGESWSGSVEGRLLLQQPLEDPEREPLRISVTYDGTLQLEESIRQSGAGAPQRDLRARAYITPFFETDHPRYHWLCETASIAFGTWEVKDGSASASFDVYSAS